MIYGIQKMSLVDYPKLPSFVIFLGGCNLCCPFCHNASIVKKEESLLNEENVLKEIEKRSSFLNAVVVTGGEPTIYGSKLISLLESLRKLHLKIKLDTNGTNPKLLKQILESDLVDYVAMDIKNTWKKYELTSGVKINTEDIKKSISIIENSNVDYEFRMTINKNMHQQSDILEVLSYVKKKDRFFLQPYHYQPTQLKDENFGEWSQEEIKELESFFFVKN